MSAQPRRSPRLLAAEWKANAIAYHARRNASRIPAGPPNTFVSTVPSPTPNQTQPVPDSTPPPRRSPRLAAKRYERMTSFAKQTLFPILNKLELTKNTTVRVILITDLFANLVLHPNILIWNPKFRTIVSNKMNEFQNKLHTYSDVGNGHKNGLTTQITFLQKTLEKIQSHPEYVS